VCTTNLQVVNALLTQLDKLKQFNNVLVMATSNLASKIGRCL
jgi:SpoVK/Ycf46/Vps4 family AAA+-type ATPase